MAASGVAGLASALEAEIGVNDEHQQVKTWLDTGIPMLNEAISGRFDGGMPVGRIVEIFGPSSAGKTAIATSCMIAAQKAGGIAMFNDHERSFDAGIAQRLGLDTDPNKWVFKTPKTFEESVMLALKVGRTVRDGKFISKDAPIVVVFDSLAAMIPKSKQAKDVDEQGMNDSLALAKATSSVFPTLAQIAEEYGMLILVLNQMRLKPGVMYGDPTTTPGGEAPRFYASVRIQLGAKRLTEGSGEDKEMTGQEVVARCIKNKVSRPFLTAKWFFRFREDGTGYVDVTESLLDFLIDEKLIESSGPRVKWTDGKMYFKKALLEKIETESLQAELHAMLPSK